MGLTSVMVRVSNPSDRARGIEAEMLVDSGAIFSVVPAGELLALGIGPERTERFSLADGTSVTRQVGIARFEVAGRSGGAPVIFGEPGDAWLLGVLSLESLGLLLDPFKRELRPMRLVLYTATAAPPAS
ncbi:MAG: aspartyl protease family protein [Candidatus Binatia bacterium]